LDSRGSDDAKVLPLRTFLLQGVRRFVERAVNLPGIERIALVGSLTTPKPMPKDTDVLVTVTVATTQDLHALAKAARSLKGHAQTRERSIGAGRAVMLAALPACKARLARMMQ
jgi:hypothetical protein